MGKLTQGGQDLAYSADEGSFNAPGNGAAVRIVGRANIAITGVFTGSLRLARSFDGGATWAPCTIGGQAVAFTGPATEEIEEIESGVLYRFECTALTAGAANWRISR